MSRRALDRSRSVRVRIKLIKLCLVVGPVLFRIAIKKAVKDDGNNGLDCVV